MTTSHAPRRVAVLGASGRVGRRIVELLVARGVVVTAQSRSAKRLASLSDRVEIHAFHPRDRAAMTEFVRGAEAVVIALGCDNRGPTTPFSEATRVLLDAMTQEGVRRVVAITGVGAGETRGHGGFIYDRIVFPLFTRHRYADKERQEALLAASDLDWTIVRPAPFAQRPVPGPLEVLTRIQPETKLTRITPDEVAEFVVGTLMRHSHVRQRPFIGHR